MDPTTTTEQNERFIVPLRLSQVSGDEGRREYSCTFITAGYVRQQNGEPAAWRIPPETLKAAVALLDQKAMFIDHPGWLDYPSMKDMFAVSFAPTWNEQTQSIDGGMRLYVRPDLAWLPGLLDQILLDQQAGREVPDVGLSLTFFGRHDWIDVGPTPGEEYERVTVEITHVISIDLVFGPGAEGRVKEMLQAVGVSAVPNLPIQNRKDGVLMEPNSNEQVQPNNETPPVPVALASPGPAEDRLARIEANIERLTAALAQQEEPKVVQGMGTPPRQPAVSGMANGIDRFSPAIDWLFGVPGATPPDPQFRRADMVYQALTGDWEWRGMFNRDRVMLTGVNSTDLPNLAVNAMNKVVLVQWASLRAYRWYELVAAVVPNDGSVQPMTWVGTGGVGALPTVAEKGVYTELSMGDSKEQASFTKYGGYVGITLEMFRNSEIAKIQAVPNGLARSAVMTRSANVASLFTANAGVGPTLGIDSKALFHTDHANLATTAFGTDSTAWNAVDLAIWNQTELGSGKPLAISPKYMLCNRTLFRAALVVFGYGDGQPTTYVPEALDRGADDPRPWPIAVPDFSDTTDWAAIVDPRLYPVIMMSYAQGAQGNVHPAPELFSVTNETQGLVFTNDLLPVKCRDWYAYGVNGYRGIAKRNVA